VLATIQDLRIDVRVTRRIRLRIVDTASLTIQKGQLLGLIGESGSGKTMLCRALVGTLNRRGAYIESGSIDFEGIDLVKAKKKDWRNTRLVTSHNPH